MINLYCDESCHLENDRIPVMVLGALACPTPASRWVADRLREIKRRHGMGHGRPWEFEVKWSKVSRGALPFYREYLDLFFDVPELSFRGLVIPNKEKLRHGDFGQSHDEWYYKMFYQTLEPIVRREEQYRIFLDIKDTLSQRRVLKLRKVLNNKMRDFDQQIIAHIQHVRSDEVEQIQLADLLIGALGYAARGLRGNEGKNRLVDHLRARSGLSWRYSTSRVRPKVNLFFWDAREIPDA
ncbi:MAG: DUF3800 domain-containing protein [Longimicrobiaceae bacterium]